MIRKRLYAVGLLLVCVLLYQPEPSSACTTLIIGKKATADGSVLMSHQEDYAPDDCMHIVHHPRMQHLVGEIIHFAHEDVAQVELTYAYTAEEMYDFSRLGSPPAKFMNGINEYGVCMSSNCFWSREELIPNDTGLIWPEICQLVMERCQTSREAVDLCTRLVDVYGFNGFEATDCEYLTFAIADANEGWIIEVGQRQWVAKRCPDDGAIMYANQAQIEQGDLASKNLVAYAVEKGWYDPDSGESFNFRQVYCPSSEEIPECKESWTGQAWNVYRMERAREIIGPKLGSVTVQDLMALHRDHYEGKEYYDLPHSREKARAICVDSTHSCEIYHLRGSMPTSIGSVMWIAASSPCCSVFTPIYAGHRGETPYNWRIGWTYFDSNSAWWRFEQVQRAIAPAEGGDLDFWKNVFPQVRKIWDEVEKTEFAETAALEKKAVRRWKPNSEASVHKMLTEYSNRRLQENFERAGIILKQYYQRAKF